VDYRGPWPIGPGCRGYIAGSGSYAGDPAGWATLRDGRPTGSPLHERMTCSRFRSDVVRPRRGDPVGRPCHCSVICSMRFPVRGLPPVDYRGPLPTGPGCRGYIAGSGSYAGDPAGWATLRDGRPCGMGDPAGWATHRVAPT
jgi:hypothetical protein